MSPLFFVMSVCWLLFLLVSAMVIADIFIGSGKSAVKTRFQKLTSVPESLKSELTAVAIDEPRRGILSSIDLQPILGRITGEGYFTQVEEQLARADLPFRVSEFLILRFAFTVVVGMSAMLLFHNIVYGILCALPVLFLHIPILVILRKSRVAKFNVQLADFLILVVNSLRAGQTFMQGCAVAVSETGNPISAEFKQVIKEVNLGMPEWESMENMLTRVPSEDLKIVVSAYVIQRKVGGNLAEILETTAATIRERIKIQGQISVLTTQGKLSGCLVGSLPFVIGFAISCINPSYIKPLLTTVPGYFLMGLAVCMQLTGAFIIWRVVDIEI
ncbi:MAG: type II secretion system F family protein [Methylacidiphilales bacterium]|nr:type II secretion system F family protein [Candidatus Methylacidiphilales bacterium]